MADAPWPCPPAAAILAQGAHRRPGENSVRVDRTGESLLLDLVADAARASNPRGGRFEIQGDGANWITTGRLFITWDYVNLE